MSIIQNTNDIILIIGASAAALGGIIAGFRMSRCRSINICNGCLKIEREIKETPAPPTTPTSEPASLTPSNSLENLNCVNV